MNFLQKVGSNFIGFVGNYVSAKFKNFAVGVAEYEEKKKLQDEDEDEDEYEYEDGEENEDENEDKEFQTDDEIEFSTLETQFDNIELNLKFDQKETSLIIKENKQFSFQDESTEQEKEDQNYVLESLRGQIFYDSFREAPLLYEKNESEDQASLDEENVKLYNQFPYDDAEDEDEDEEWMNEDEEDAMSLENFFQSLDPAVETEIFQESEDEDESDNEDKDEKKDEDFENFFFSASNLGSGFNSGFLGETEERDEFGDPIDNRPALSIYGTDLTLLAREGKLEETFGRENEVTEMMEILVRRQKNNPVLVGDAGVGKTAIIELFANKIVNHSVPFVLEGRTIISLDLTRMVAGSRYRGEFELRLQRVMDEVLNQPNTIIFIDEIHNILGAGSAEGSLDAANILKPILSRSGFQCIGASTNKEYERIEKDAALNRRFQPIAVKEPTIDQTINILFGLRPNLEAFHNVEIQPGAIAVAVELAKRYITDRFLPDKAIDLIDRAAAKAVIEITSVRDGSVISALVNASLNKIGLLRVEAFRRGDTASEFVFQELDNAYRNFLLRWVENPTAIPTDRPIFLSPISQGLFDQMRCSILARVDELLFSSPKPRYDTRKIPKIIDLSPSKNDEIYDVVIAQFTDENEELPLPITVYRFSLFLAKTWLEQIQSYPSSKIKQRLKKAKDLVRISNKNFLVDFFPLIFEYLRLNESFSFLLSPVTNEEGVTKFVFSNLLPYEREYDFFEEDIEQIEETFEILSQLEEMRVEIVQEFLFDLKPVMRKAILESLQSTSPIEFTTFELSTIYHLLGYFSTYTGREFLVNLDDPALVRRSRQLGDFGLLKRRITQDDVRKLLSSMTGIPIQSLSVEESKKLMDLEKNFHERDIGQEEAVSAIAKAIRRSRLGIQNPKRPIASFLFCGPTGVGKTEVTKAVAATMFGSENEMIRFDMSEFMEKFTISRLIGSPPGYVGYDEGGQLTDAVRRKPYSVVLFDEVEKAHPDILNILLQILEDGRLTDSQKRLIPFENTIIIMTSNAAAEEIQQIIKAQGQLEQSSSNNDEKEKKEVINKQSFEELNNQDQNGEEIDSERLESKDLENEGKLKRIPYIDEYQEVINFLESPLTENFFVDLKKKIKGEMRESFLFKTDEENIEQRLNRAKQKEKDSEKTTSSKTSKVNSEKDVLQRKKEVNKDLKEAVLQRLTELFLPEFLNRLDDIIIFQPLTVDELRKVCDIMIKEVKTRLTEKKIEILIDDGVRTKLTREGYNPMFGARPLRRLITKNIEDLISENLLSYPRDRERIMKFSLNEEDEIILTHEDV